MTSKEKAEEVYAVFLSLTNDPKIAKQCALTAIDYMICNAGMIWGGRDTETGLTARDTFRKHWLEVKQELENL
jgi:hypothetical protein